MRRWTPLLTLLAGLAAGSVRADDAAPSATAPRDVGALLARLDAPFLAEREGAIEALVALGPAARPAVTAAFRDPACRRRAELARVLAADGTPEALDALLDVLPTVTDLATERAVQRSLIEHAEHVTDTVLAYRDDRGKVPPSVATVAALLVRARIEARFLSRKSASGSTGSYPGQFDVLKPDRRRAVEICRDILRDRAAKVPGVFPVGTYAFLRPPPFLAERLELQSMAVHALAELTVEDDRDILDELEDTYVDLYLRGRALQRQQGRRDAESALADGVLAVLVRRRPAGPVRREALDDGLNRRFPPTWKELAIHLIDVLRTDPDTDEDAAQLALQIGRFDLAVDIYRRLLRLTSGGIAHYNLACAYARWSREPRPNDDPESLRERAMDEMEAAHAAGYLDWVWMGEDRDLDPIRDMPRFAALVERMKQSFVMPKKAGGR
ncbi:MAG: hypothetical protein U1E39_14620 [Planctomycetota bacterium]